MGRRNERLRTCDACSCIWNDVRYYKCYREYLFVCWDDNMELSITRATARWSTYGIIPRSIFCQYLSVPHRRCSTYCSLKHSNNKRKAITNCTVHANTKRSKTTKPRQWWRWRWPKRWCMDIGYRILNAGPGQRNGTTVFGYLFDFLK